MASVRKKNPALDCLQDAIDADKKAANRFIEDLCKDFMEGGTHKDFCAAVLFVGKLDKAIRAKKQLAMRWHTVTPAHPFFCYT